MIVNKKAIKPCVDDIYKAVCDFRKTGTSTNNIVKSLNKFLSKKGTNAPFTLDEITFEKSDNGKCFYSIVTISDDFVNMLMHRIYDEDDIDASIMTMLNTGKMKFNIVIDKNIFNTSHSSEVISNSEITTMLIYQVLSLYDDDFRNQLIFNYKNILYSKKGLSHTEYDNIYSEFDNNHLYYNCDVSMNSYDVDTFKIDKILSVIGLDKYLISLIEKINLRNSPCNSSRINKIKKFSKANKSDTLELVIEEYNSKSERMKNMDNKNDYSLGFLHEAYFGKNKNILQIENIFQDCVDYVKKYNHSLVSNTVDIKCSKYINKQLMRLEDIVMSEFGFSTSSIRLTHMLPTINAFTYITFELFNMHKMKVVSTKDGVKYIDGAAFICEIGDQIFTGNYTGAEITAVFLHEIGHQFYRNNNTEYVRLMLINEVILAITSGGMPVTTINQLKNEFSAMTLRNYPNLRKLSDFMRKIDGTFAKLTAKLGMLLNTLNITSIFEIVGSIITMVSSWLTQTKHDKYNEKFADNFASSYGYGKDLSSALSKMSMEHVTGDNIPIITYLKDLTSFIPNMLAMMYDVHPPTYARILSQYKYLEKELNSSNMDANTKKELKKQLVDIKDMLDRYPSELVENQELRGRFFTAWAYSVADVNESRLYTNHDFPEKLDWDQLKSTNEDSDIVFEEPNHFVDNRVNNLVTNIEELKVSYINGKDSDVHQCQNNVSKSLNNLCQYFNKRVKINECIICDDNGDTEDDMFGARAVFTSMDNVDAYLKNVINMHNMDRILETIFSKAEFNIEIDHNILCNNQYNFTSREICAILLHELGHMLDTNVYSRIAMAYQSAIINLANIKSLKNNTNTRALCALYIISNMESDRLFSRDRKSITFEEVKADSFVGNLGLSADLNSAIDKFYKVNKHNFFRNKSFKEMISDAENFVQASMVYCTRKRKINRLVLTEKIKQKSKSIKSLLDNISRDVLKHGDDCITNGDAYVKDDGIGGIVNESFDFIKKFKKSPHKISSYDIDTLRIQSEMIEDANDKQIMIYKIFKRRSQITEMLQDEDFKKENKDYSIILQSYLDTLNDLYEKVMSVKISNQIQKYGVFIKYPKGYEG